ncbi:uncharacterized protein METZ01_LOCUS326935, partial [marine metagenome]
MDVGQDHLFMKQPKKEILSGLN